MMMRSLVSIVTCYSCQIAGIPSGKMDYDRVRLDTSRLVRELHV